jgi:nucleoside-diphosphate-sugar epimerase
MNVLVTGSNGFIASNLIKKLQQEDDLDGIYCLNKQSGVSLETAKRGFLGSKTMQVFGNLNNRAFCESMFGSLDIDVIFHFAAKQGKTLGAFDENVQATSNLLKYCKRGTRFIYASSSTVYGDLGIDKVCVETDKTTPTSLYGASKLTGENLVNVVGLAGEVSVLVLRFCAIVGQDANHGLVPDLIRKMGEPGGTVEMFGDYPGSIKPYLHVDQCVNAIMHLFQGGYTGTYNVCPDDSVSVCLIAELIRRCMGVEKDFRWLGKESLSVGDNRIVKMSNRKLEQSGFAFSLSNQTSILNVRQAVKDILGAII